MLDLSKLLGFDKVNIKTSIQNCVKEYGIEYEGVRIISSNGGMYSILLKKKGLNAFF